MMVQPKAVANHRHARHNRGKIFCQLPNLLFVHTIHPTVNVRKNSTDVLRVRCLYRSQESGGHSGCSSQLISPHGLVVVTDGESMHKIYAEIKYFLHKVFAIYFSFSVASAFLISSRQDKPKASQRFTSSHILMV